MRMLPRLLPRQDAARGGARLAASLREQAALLEERWRSLGAPQAQQRALLARQSELLERERELLATSAPLPRNAVAELVRTFLVYPEHRAFRG